MYTFVCYICCMCTHLVSGAAGKLSRIITTQIYKININSNIKDSK